MEPKSKTLDEILNEIAEKDTEIEKLEKERAVIAKENTEIEKLTDIINKSDELPETDTAKLSKEDRAKILEKRELKITDLDKKLEVKTDAIQVLQNERNDLSNRIDYLNGTRFQYSDNIDEKNSKVSVSLYGIIQSEGKIIEDKEIAVSETKKYKKKLNDDTGLEAVKQRLKEQLIADNTARIFKDYNVWIIESAVAKRPNKGQLPSYIIAEEAEKKKEPKGTKPGQTEELTPGKFVYTASAKEKKQIGQIGTNPNIKNSPKTHVEQVDLSTLPITNKKDLLNKTPSKFESKTSSTGTNEPTGNSVITNQFNNNNNFNSATQESNLTAAEVSTATMFNAVKKSIISINVQSLATLEKQIATGKDTYNNLLTSSDKVRKTKEINELKTKISESITSYNSNIQNGEAAIDEKEIMNSSTDSAVDILKKEPIASSVNNTNNIDKSNNIGKYVSVENNITSPASIADQLGGKESPYLNSKNEEDGTETNRSKEISDGVNLEATAATNTGESIQYSDAELNKILGPIGGTGNNETPKPTSYATAYANTEVTKKPPLNSNNIAALIKDPTTATGAKIVANGDKTNNLLNQITSFTTNSPGQKSEQTPINIDGANNQIVNNTNNMPQLVNNPQPESVSQAPEPVDYSQYFAQLINLHSATYEVLTTGARFKIVT